MSLKTTLMCDMKDDCRALVTHIDEKGFGYCREHGIERRESGIRCRQLTSAEYRQLMRGEPLAGYEPRSRSIDKQACIECGSTRAELVGFTNPNRFGHDKYCVNTEQCNRRKHDRALTEAIMERNDFGRTEEAKA